MKRVLRTFSYFRPDLARISLALALMLGSVVANVIKPWPLALLVDTVLGNKPAPESLQRFFDGPSASALILSIVAVLVIVHFAQGALSAAQNFVAIKVGLRGLTRVRKEVFGSLQRLSMRFHQRSNIGDLIFRASWDTYSFQTLFQQGAMTSLSAVVSLLLMVVVMSQVNLTLTLVSLATVPLLLGIMTVFGKAMRERGARAQQADSQVTSLVQQSIAALPLIQSNTREEHEQGRFDAATTIAERRRIAQHGSELVYWFFISVVFALGTAAIVWLGSLQVLAGTLTVGQLLVFLAYLAQLYEPLNQLSHVGATVATAAAATTRVFELLDTREFVPESPHARPVTRGKNRASDGSALLVQGALSFRQVTFSYRAECPVLRDVTFNLEAGESCAVIGPSGAGKSSLLNLVPRFYDPDSGAVFLDGADLRDLRLKDLRECISVVMQEPILLPTSVTENIRYGRPEASASEVEAAARAAHAHEFIERLPDGYLTTVGEGAARLSVGERQRISIARAFLKDAPILLLDEPTSALDAESEAKVVSSLFNLMRGRTTLIVAHRLSTIKNVTRVLVLEAGAVTAFGSPSELLASEGYYARAVRAIATR